ncbi:phospho-N-acetylmuramoyl-pentapeptide-transferase [bacterium]|nr:phospho-N-acetylmuramoyl-pentapeptide-transferase [bacterium]
MNSLILGFLLGLLLPLFSHRLPLKEKNFQGIYIPKAGFLIPFVGSIYFLFSKDFISALTLFSFGVLGFADDVWGLKDVKGFKGHFSLLFKGKFSTGWLKALGGGVIAIIIASSLYSSLPRILLSAFVIAASANFLNLLDLRPGRCLKAFALLSFLSLLFSGKSYPFLFSFALAFLVYDLREKAMLGDSGSNSLGAILGLSFAYTPLYVQICYASFLFVMILLGEFVSFSKLIAGNSFLRILDNLGRKTPL